MRIKLSSISAAFGILIGFVGMNVAYRYIEQGGSLLLGCLGVVLVSVLVFLLCMDAMFSEK